MEKAEGFGARFLALTATGAVCLAVAFVFHICRQLPSRRGRGLKLCDTKCPDHARAGSILPTYDAAVELGPLGESLSVIEKPRVCQ